MNTTTILERQLAASVAENERLGLVRAHTQAIAPTTGHELTVAELVDQVRKVQEVMQAVMREGEHYGKVPGTDKPTLLKPGAEKLCLLFRLSPEYELIEHVRDGDHLTITTRCALLHIPTGQRRGTGLGSCSTRESKYAYRKGERVCPKCGAAAIIRGQAQYGGGWLCWKKKDGCGAKFKEKDASIESQKADRVANPDVPDTYNTVLKMSNKRALVAAVLNATAASDIFTQDLEDLPDREPAEPAPHAPGNISPHVDPDEDPNAPSPKNSPYPGLMAELVQIEGQLELVESYDQTLAIRAEFGSKAKPGARIPKAIQQAKETRSVNPGEYKSLCQIWARCDRRLAKLEAQLTPSAEDSFRDPDDATDEREPGADG